MPSGPAWASRPERSSSPAAQPACSIRSKAAISSPWCWRNYTGAGTGTFILLFGNQEKSVDYPFPSTNAGFITDMNKLAGLYSAADIFLNPTLQDVLSNVALESMACKTPSVTFRTGGVPEAVLDGRTGLVAPQGDLNQMAAHCERLIQDGKLLQTLAEEGRRHAEQTFSYPVIAARHAALYEETLREYRYEE